MNILRTAEGVAVILTLIGIFFTAYFKLDTSHAQREAVVETEIELRSDILDRDIKKDAEARVYYKNLQMSRPLEPAEQRRLEYLEENLERKYEEQRMLKQLKAQLRGN